MKELYTTAGIFVVLILLGVWMVQNNRNEQEKKLVQLRKKWGKKQEKRTAREKKEKLEACLRRKQGKASAWTRLPGMTWISMRFLTQLTTQCRCAGKNICTRRFGCRSQQQKSGKSGNG